MVPAQSHAFAKDVYTETGRNDITEYHLVTHDIAIPLPIQPTPDKKPQRFMRFLLLSPTSITQASLAATLSRCHHFASLTGGVNLAIIVLLNPPAARPRTNAVIPTRVTSDSEQPFVCKSNNNADSATGVYAYAKLQAELLTVTDIPILPILPCANLAELADLLISYTDGVKRGDAVAQSLQPPTAEAEAETVTAMDLLEWCTTDPPLSPLAVSLATDVFPSLRVLAAEATSCLAFSSSLFSSSQRNVEEDDDNVHDEMQRQQNGFAELRLQLDEGVVTSMLEFWEGEWTVD